MSEYQGDIVEDSTVYFKFRTIDGTGLPTTLLGTPALRVYKGNSVAQSTAGITLVVDFDSLTGLNHVTVVTTDAFYAAGEDYEVVVQAGTVDGISIVGYNVGSFSIENRNIKADLVSIDGQATSGNNATLNLKQLNIVNSAGDAITAESTGSNGNGMKLEGDGTGQGLHVTGGADGDGVRFSGGINGGSGLRSFGTVGFAGFRLDGQGAGAALDLAGGTTGQGMIAQGGATSGEGIKAMANGGNSNGMTLVGDGTGKDISASEIDTIDANVDSLIETLIKASGQAAGGTANTITLVGESAVDDFYKWDIVTLDEGASSAGGQSRLIISYDGASKVATVFPNWEVIPPTPNGTAAEYKIIPGGLKAIYSFEGVTLMDVNTAQISGSTPAAIALSLWMETIVTGSVNEATPPTNGFEVTIDGGATVTQGQMLIMQDSSSLGAGEARIISADITGSTTITLDKALRAAPVNGDTFIILPAAQGDDLLRLNTELAAAPAITGGLRDFIKWVLTVSRNRITETSALQTIRNDADSADIATRTMSDNGTTFDSGKAT